MNNEIVIRICDDVRSYRKGYFTALIGACLVLVPTTIRLMAENQKLKAANKELTDELEEKGKGEFERVK